MADAVGWTYRKDWFARPEMQAEFKKKYGRDLAPPKTYDELKQIAKFFQGREIDGKKVYGAYIFTERGSEGITMGVTNVLYNYGFEYENPKKPYQMQGFVNSPDAVKGLEVYKELYKCCTAPGMTNAYMQEGLDAFKSGQVAMQMNWFAFFPGLYKDPNVGGDKIGFFVNPARPKGQFTQLGGQGISVVAYSDHKDDALQYIKWFAQPEVQQKWWELGGYSGAQGGRRRTRLPEERAVRRRIPRSRWTIVKDFWAEPSYAELLLDMQKRVHDYVVADKGTAQGGARSAGQGLDQGVQGGRQEVPSKAASPGVASGRTPGETCPSATRCSGRCQKDDDGDHRPIASAGRIGEQARSRPHGACAGCRTAASPGCSSRRRSLLLLAINIFPLIWTIRLSFTNYQAEPAERAARICRHRQLRRHPDRSRTSGTRCRSRRASSFWSVALEVVHRLRPRAV